MKVLNQKNKDRDKYFTIILSGFLLFGLKEFAELIYHPLQALFASIGLIFIFGASFYYRINLLNPLTGNIRLFFTFYLCWIFFIISRPLITGQEYSNNSFHPYLLYGITSYLLPLIVLFGKKIISFKKLFASIFIFSFIGFVFFVFNFNNMLSIVKIGATMSEEGKLGLGELAEKYMFWFSISFFSLLCYEFIPLKYRITAIFTSIFLLFLLAFFGRRGAFVMSILYFFGMFYLFLDQKNNNNKILIFLIIFIFFFSIYVIISKYSNSTFFILYERLNDDSRSDVEETLIKYLTTEKAWLFGKGIEGAYKHRYFEFPRYTHETGYFYLILKGGIINLFLFVYLLLHATYIGLFKTNNRLTKAFALYLLFHVIYLIPFGLPTFSLEYLFVWVAFTFCESIYWRSLTNEEVKIHLAIN
jgi:hypothetical protein